MIRKYLLYAFAFTSLIFTSCMDSFLDRNPYGAIDETTFYTLIPQHFDLTLFISS